MHHKTQMLESPKMQAEAEACWSHASLGYDLVLKKKKSANWGEKRQGVIESQGTVPSIQARDCSSHSPWVETHRYVALGHDVRTCMAVSALQTSNYSRLGSCVYLRQKLPG